MQESLLVKLAYDGTDFHGTSPLVGLRTVGGELRAAFERLGAGDVQIDPWTRTDRGVHADACVVAVQGVPVREARVWLGGLERQLPADLRPVALARVDAWPVAGAKTYVYTLDTSFEGEVRLHRRAWRVRPSFEILTQAAREVVGEVDFSAFRRRGDTRTHYRRTLEACEWRASGSVWTCTLRAQGFPLHGARALVGGMVHAALGYASVESFAAALRGVPHPVARQGAPARGLCLVQTALVPEPDWVRLGPRD